MSEMSIKIPASKPRNPWLVEGLRRRAGAHRKPHKSERHLQRQQLQTQLPQLLQEG